MTRMDPVWKQPEVVRQFLKGVRGGIPFGAEQIEVMLRVVEARREPVGDFADLGCGDGILTRSILSRYPAARGTLVDFSPPMIEAAQRALGPHAVQLHFTIADLGSAAWSQPVRARAPFDLVVSGYAIHHLPDTRKRDLYGEIFGLLRPGGLFVNIEHVASQTPWVESISDHLFVDSLHAFQISQNAAKTRAEIAGEFASRPDKAANILAPVEAQCEWLRQLGYRDVDCYFKVFELAVFGGRRRK